MTLYLQKQQSSVTWPEPLESTWQLLGGEGACDLAVATCLCAISRQNRCYTRMNGFRCAGQFVQKGPVCNDR